MEEAWKQWLFDPTVAKLVSATVAIMVVFTVVRLLQRGVSNTVEDVDTRYRVRKLVQFLGYIASGLLLATIFSDKLAGLTVAFGVAGAGIAFALQEVIASAAGWIAISFGGFYSPGDRVQLGGIRGDVIDIGILRTTMMELGGWVDGDLYNGRIVRIANSYVFKEPVFNYSADFPFLWDEIKLPVRYGSDWRYASDVLLRAAKSEVGNYDEHSKAAWKSMVKKFVLEDAKLEPAVTMVLNDNWMEYTVRYVVDYQARRATKDKLFRRIMEEVDNSQGKIKMASATVELVAGSFIDVRMNEQHPNDRPI